MKKVIVILLLFFVVISTTGCWRYGKGETIGYIYAVDDGILWDKVWYKSNLESSESDCYLINDDNLKQQLKTVSGDTRIKMFYDKHFATLSKCPDGTRTNDEIIRFEILND